MKIVIAWHLQQPEYIEQHVRRGKVLRMLLLEPNTDQSNSRSREKVLSFRGTFSNSWKRRRW